ncbi:MAG: diguanylate cyclase [Clostridia bacterium]|nr:diguanylate cyclase [Clostridia bacterium]
MDNTSVVGIYLPFVLLTTVIFISACSRYRKARQDLMFILLCFCMLGWFACKLPTLIVEGIPERGILRNLDLLFVGFIPPFLFLFMQEFFHPSYKPSPSVVFFLFLIPAGNALMVLTSGSHELIRQISVRPAASAYFAENPWGPWFWVLIGYCFAQALTIIGIILVGHFHMPKFYRPTSAMMVLCISLVLACSAPQFLSLTPPNLELTAIAGSVALLLVHLAMTGSSQSIFVRFARSQVFSHLDEFILVLDENGLVADYNPGADRWFSSQGLDLSSCSLQGVMDALRDRKVAVTEWVGKENRPDQTVDHGGYSTFLNLRTHDLTDERGQKVGSIAIFTDVSENRALIDRLEAKAGVDILTGLANRLAYEGAKKRLDTPEHIPLSCVMCDINGLKAVNDSFGHSFGDMMVRAVAETLEKLCPKSSFLARIGGDEFIYLWPHSHMEDARELMERIGNALSGADSLPFEVSVAMGAAVRDSIRESMDDVIALADSRMYQQKKRINENLR